MTNRQVSETADIVQARATGFVFKPHGDLDDAESIVLTREHYRTLVNERPHVVDALSTLMVSRPVVYVGFGLRDPDFLLIKDRVSSTYGGAARDHYAILPDVSAEEASYWRRNHGMVVVSYETREEPDGARSHHRLLSLLREVAAARLPSSGEVSTVRSTLALARHAAHTAKNRPEELAEPLPVTVSYDRQQPDLVSIPSQMRYGRPLAPDFFREIDFSCVLLGAPGSGKTHALREAAAEMAAELSEACLDDSNSGQFPRVPIYLDLRGYEGSFSDMVDDGLPASLHLANLLSDGRRVVLFLDSFNEMPQQFVESGKYAGDLQEFLKRVAPNPVVIASRSAEGLADLGLPIFRLEDLQSRFVRQNLPRSAADLPEGKRLALARVLRKPFFFRLYKRYSEDADTHLSRPHELFEMVLDSAAHVCDERFGVRPELRKLMAPAGYWAIQNGMELIPIAVVRDCLEPYEASVEELGHDADVLSVLFAEGLFVPVAGGRVSFVHQALTEYLAASELARRIQADPEVLSSIVESRRWDYSVLLTLGFLDEGSSSWLLGELLRVDPAFAVRAVALAEHGRTEATSRLLAALREWSPATFQDLSDAAHQMAQLEIHEEHLPLLWELAAKGNLIGGAAAALAIDLDPDEMKAKALNLILDRHSDYNLVAGVARVVAPVVTKEDRRWLLDRIAERHWTPVGRDGFPGLSSAVGPLLAVEDPSTLVDAVEAAGAESRALVSVVVDALREEYSKERLSALVRILPLWPSEVVFALYSQLRWAELSSTDVQEAVPEDTRQELIRMIESGDEGASWAAEAYRLLVLKWNIGTGLLQAAIGATSGIPRVVLSWCAFGGGSHFERAVGDEDWTCVGTSPEALGAIPGDAWLKHPSALLKVVSPDRPSVSRVVLDSVRMAEVPFPDVEIPNIDGLCAWVEKVAAEGDRESHWLAVGLGDFLARAGAADQGVREQLIAWFDRSSAPDAFGCFVLGSIPDLELAELGEDAVDRLVDALSAGPLAEFPTPLLGVVGTKDFYRTRLETLLGQSELLDRNVQALGSMIGRRLGVRLAA